MYNCVSFPPFQLERLADFHHNLVWTLIYPNITFSHFLQSVITILQTQQVRTQYFSLARGGGGGELTLKLCIIYQPFLVQLKHM